MKKGTLSVPRNGLVTIPAEMVQAARFKRQDQIVCGWTSQEVVVAPSPSFDKLGPFTSVIVCPIKKDGTIKVPYDASHALQLSPGATIAVQVKPERIGLRPGPVGATRV
jgi:antitoxin component of MazEF toxin-antitoxin module